MEELIKDYVNNLFTIKELATKYHIGQDKVRKILKENNIYIRTNGETSILKKNRNFTLEEIEKKVIENYLSGMGQIKSGKEFNLSSEKVKKILLKNNIPIRNLHEAICLTNSLADRTATHYFKNEDFFSIETPDMAWLLGFLASDGNICKNSNTIRIELSIVDVEILERIKKVVGIENPIHFREDKKGFNFCNLNWGCAKHKKELEKYNIVPAKTYILKPPTILNEKYYIDYIRGYFDGDGTININKQKDGRKSLRWSICGASKEVLQWILNVLEEQYGIPKVNIHRDSSHENDFWSFVYSTNSTRKIYDILYTPNSLYLKRKKDKFEKLLAEVNPNKSKTPRDSGSEE